MKYSILFLFCLLVFSCENRPTEAASVKQEQTLTEQNQSGLLRVQPPPKISWSLERDNLTKRFKLMNDRGVVFYMYVYAFASPSPIGYYQVNKVSSVNSQLTNPEQIVNDPFGSFDAGSVIVSAPAEDGSYGTNGDAVFGFTPEDIYIEHNMQYIISTVPLNLKADRLATISVENEKQFKELMQRINN